MMKRNLLFNAIAMATLPLAILSCSKDDETVATPTVTSNSATNVAADPAVTGNKYILFSLENNAIVPNSDSATNKWDIGFRSTTIITNGGQSGPAQGGAFVQRGTTFAEYKQVSNDSTFRTDVIAPTASYAIPTGSGRGWYNYDPTTNIISPIPGNILVVRTATGKFAKVEITSYYKNSPTAPTATSEARNYNFRFAVQTNGSKTF